MIPKKPKRKDDETMTEFLYRDRNYYKSIAERAIEALKLAEQSLEYRSPDSALRHVKEALHEISASEEE